MKLNLGCSDNLLDGYVNVDRVLPADEIMDLGAPYEWPWSDISEVRAHDIFEHLENKIRTMNECWRVLRPGGILDLFIPTTDGRGAFQDCQHVSYWNVNSLFYYCEEFAEWQRFHEAYGVRARFKCIGPNPPTGRWPNGSPDHRLYGPEEDNVWKMHAILEAIK